MDGWIDITEFASKYGVSASTLRRRIRSHTIPFKMEKGKYLIQDSSEALSEAPLFSRQNRGDPRQSVASGNLHDPVGDFMRDTGDASYNGAAAHAANMQLRADLDASHNENRKLKAQLAELETLIRALEGELQEKTQ